jgi:hypothetical protein
MAMIMQVLKGQGMLDKPGILIYEEMPKSKEGLRDHALYILFLVDVVVAVSQICSAYFG